ncbi:ATP-dependent RNA helicase SUV3 homolog, mitochondrial [Caerostris extrusa]|uniref:ATP-dependent RNA helicase SUV3 homolog, mitochondrial n=1 Tax=Caerostris extrusa TaxID=172846 RepID=A0AAV4TW80_CAEEX|nr:ATP-dependent RNA helicase SUV3 homolog, mitochondrial [Caerostris extrusa]
MRTSVYHSCINCVTSIRTQHLSSLRTNASLRLFRNKFNPVNTSQFRWKSENVDLSSIVIPVPLKPVNNVDDTNVGEELTSTKIHKADLLKLINKFCKEANVIIIAAEHGLDSKLFHRAAISFRNFCMESTILPVDLHIVLSNILQGSGHITDILPYFIDHAKQVFPHLECMEELKNISDLRRPADWYQEARIINRKLIFHAGPTNSGKTYRALERFITSKSGVYCGPLKLLAVEVFNKTNEKGTPCDLVTGEERHMVLPDNTPASHVACTIEMVSVETKYDVAVIDEIQMIKDPGRGWAWTRALLGLCADEIHICGEAAAIDLVKEIANQCGEELEVRKYDRLTSLTIENRALMDLSKIQPGDCIVCFSKNDIFNVSLDLEKKGFECAVIYGGLPPGTKLAQAKKFNDPSHPCKILVATDAIGMGLNLSIRRVIFYSLMKPVINEKGEKEVDTISPSQALQIGGRAGRYNTPFSEGFVTTFRNEDLPILKNIMSKDVENLEKAGLHPTADQVETFAHHLPHATLSNLIDIFISLCVVDTSSYFMCDTEGFKFLAEMIQHMILPVRARYVFCCAPINKKQPFVCSMFTKFAKQYSLNEPLTANKLCKMIGGPFSAPKNLTELMHQEAVFDVLDLYLWLSYRFPDLFPDVDDVRSFQRQLDEIIQQGVFNITHLLKNDEIADDVNDLAGTRSFNKKGPFASSEDLEPEELEKFGQGKLTQELLNKGVFTPQMLRILQREWQESNPLNSPRSFKSSKVYTRRNKKK